MVERCNVLGNLPAPFIYGFRGEPQRVSVGWSLLVRWKLPEHDPLTLFWSFLQELLQYIGAPFLLLYHLRGRRGVL